MDTTKQSAKTVQNQLHHKKAYMVHNRGKIRLQVKNYNIIPITIIRIIKHAPFCPTRITKFLSTRTNIRELKTALSTLECHLMLQMSILIPKILWNPEYQNLLLLNIWWKRFLNNSHNMGNLEKDIAYHLYLSQKD